MRCRSRRWHGLVLAFAALAGVGDTATSASAQSEAQDAKLIQALRASARGSVKIKTKRSTGSVAFITAGRNGDLQPASPARAPKAKARDFLADYAPLLGVDSGSRLVQTASAVDARGATHLAYEQRYKGLRVFGAELKAHVDAAGDLTAVNGVAVPAIALSVTPRLSKHDAAERALALVASEPLGDEVGAPRARPGARTVRATSTRLVVYRTGLIRGVRGSNQLAYQVEVSNGANVREMVFVHANARKVLNRYSLVPDALHRVLYERSTESKVWEEGAPFPGALDGDQQNVVNFSGDAYRSFFNAFSRDSYDGAGASMVASRSVV